MSRTKPKEKEKDKKPARIAAGPGAPGFARSMGETVGRAVSAFLPLLGLALTGTLITFIFWKVAHCESPLIQTGAGRAAVSPADRERLTTAAIRNAVLQKPRPAWIMPKEYEQIAALGLFAQNRSVFDSGLSRAIAERYESSPWVARVTELRLRYPARLELDIEWRKPAARVENAPMVLDEKGYVLNMTSAPEVPLIAGMTVNRTEIGRQVREPELNEGLQLIGTMRDALNTSPGQLKASCIFREPAGTWRVITDRGPTIYWGVYSDEPPMDEPRTREKVDLLRRRLSEIKDPSLIEYVKVYTAQAPVMPRGGLPAREPAATPVRANTGSTPLVRPNSTTAARH